MSVEGTIVAEADLARVEADQQHAAAQQRRAAMVVASSAHDAKDAQLLLSILGLDSAVIDAARQECAGTPAPSTTRKRKARAA